MCDGACVGGSGSNAKYVKVMELSKISNLKEPDVEEHGFVLFHFNHQQLSCPQQQQSDIFNTAGIHPPVIHCHHFFLPTEHTLFTFSAPLSQKKDIAVFAVPLLKSTCWKNRAYGQGSGEAFLNKFLNTGNLCLL